MVDLGTYKDKFSDSGKRIFEHAVRESRTRDQNYIAIEHVINALLNEEAELINDTLRGLALDSRAIKVVIDKRLESPRLSYTGRVCVSRRRRLICSNARWTGRVRRVARQSNQPIC